MTEQPTPPACGTPCDLSGAQYPAGSGLLPAAVVGSPTADETVELDTPGAMIRWARKQASMTQQDLGAELGVVHSQISMWETGTWRVSAESFIRACAACGFNVVLEPMDDE